MFGEHSSERNGGNLFHLEKDTNCNKTSQYFSVPSSATLSTDRSSTLSELIAREAGRAAGHSTLLELF